MSEAAVKRLYPGRLVMVKTPGWRTYTYQGMVVAFVPKNTQLPEVKGGECKAAKRSTFDRYLVTLTEMKSSSGWKELKRPRFYAPIASWLENDNQTIK